MAGAHAEQLAWERRAGRIAAAAAVVAIGMPFAGALYAGALIPGERTAVDQLVAVSGKPTEFLAVACIQALSYVVLALPLYYLVRAARYRRPQVPVWLAWLAVAAPVFIGAVAIVAQFAESAAAQDYVRSGPRTVERAREIVRDRAPNELRIASALLFAGVLAAVNLSALRTGLFSRFLGMLGFVAAATMLLPGGGLLLLFWLGAVALLFVDRWPGGRGPAWESGEDEPWPSMADRARAAEAAREGDQPPAVSANGDASPLEEERPATADPDHPQATDPRAAVRRQAAQRRRRRRRR